MIGASETDFSVKGFTVLADLKLQLQDRTKVYRSEVHSQFLLLRQYL